MRRRMPPTEGGHLSSRGCALAAVRSAASFSCTGRQRQQPPSQKLEPVMESAGVCSLQGAASAREARDSCIKEAARGRPSQRRMAQDEPVATDQWRLAAAPQHGRRMAHSCCHKTASV